MATRGNSSPAPFLTEGLKDLLRRSLTRLNGQGGSPVMELKTNFGGGKTHSLLALYHLFSDTPASSLAGMDELLGELEIHDVGAAPSVLFSHNLLILRVLRNLQTRGRLTRLSAEI